MAAVLVGFSTTVWQSVALEFRAYAFVLLFASLGLYSYVQKNQTAGNRWKTIYSLSLTCLAMSHYFGMLLCGAFFAADTFLVCKKRISVKAGLQYVLPGAISIIWLLLVYVVTLRHESAVEIAGWYGLPTISGIRSIIFALAGGNTVTDYLTWVGVAFMLVKGYHCLKCREFSWGAFHQLFLLAVIALVFGVMYVYGNWINPKATMFEMRYYVILIPFIVLLFPVAHAELTSVKRTGEGLLGQTISLFICIVLIWNCCQNVPTAATTMPYREAADWIYTQSNYIFNSDTAIVTTNSSNSGAWNEYYMGRKGRRDELDILITDQIDFVNRCNDGELYNKVYLYEQQWPLEWYAWSYLTENYDLEETKPEISLSVYTRKGV